MSERYPGGFITKSPTAPTSTAAPGVWTLEQAMQYIKAGTWPLTYDPYFEYTTLLLPGTGTNGAQNNTFLDSSTNNFTITRNGNTTQGTFSPFSQTGWSNYFGGTSGNYIATTSAGSSVNFGTGDFTLECWLFATSTTGNNFVVDARSSGSQNHFCFLITDGYWLWQSSGTNIIYTNSNMVTLNTWNHVAFVRSSGTLTLYVNGTSVSSATDNSNYGTAAAGRPGIGGGGYNTTMIFNGSVSNLRIVKGTAVYTGAFTPPTTPLTNITNTSLLTCQSNRFVDNSSNAYVLTPNGTTSVQAFSPFNPTAAWSAATNGGSGYFDGTGDYITAPSNTAFALSGVYTVEFWYYPTMTFTSSTVSAMVGETTTGGFILYTDDGSRGISLGSYNVASQLTTSTYPVSNSWNHIVAVRNSSNVTSVYLNGTRIGTATLSTSYASSGSVLNVGNFSTSYAQGYFSGVRILKGTAAYDPTQTTLTVPTAPFTNITNTSLLLNFTNAGIYDATAKNDLETVGNAQISTAQSKFGGSSMYFDGTGDYLKAPGNQLFAFGAGDFTIEAWVRFASVGSSVIVGNINNSGYGDWAFIYNSAAAVLRMLLNNNAVTLSSSSWTPSANTWYHVAITRSGSTYRFFVDGTQTGSGTDSTSITWTTANSIYVGSANDGNLQLNGYIDDLRITKGIARYTANFTAPTAPFQLL